MKKIAALAFFLLFASSLQARLNPALSGSWYNPEQAGHGFNIEIIPQGDDRYSTALVYWYVYDHSGNPIFLMGQGYTSGNELSVQMYWHWGMEFGSFNPGDLHRQVWGTLSIEFHSCNSATAHYESNLVHDGNYFGTDSIELTRLTSVANDPCASSDEVLVGTYAIDKQSISGQVLNYKQDASGWLYVWSNGVFYYYLEDTNGDSAFGWGEHMSGWYDPITSPTNNQYDGWAEERSSNDRISTSLNLHISFKRTADGTRICFDNASEAMLDNQCFKRSLDSQRLVGWEITRMEVAKPDEVHLWAPNVTTNNYEVFGKIAFKYSGEITGDFHGCEIASGRWGENDPAGDVKPWIEMDLVDAAGKRCLYPGAFIGMAYREGKIMHIAGTITSSGYSLPIKLTGPAWGH